MLNEDSQKRAADLRRQIAAAGWTLAEFGRRSGLSRNVVYRLAKGGKPSTAQIELIPKAFMK